VTNHITSSINILLYPVEFHGYKWTELWKLIVFICWFYS